MESRVAGSNGHAFCVLSSRARRETGHILRLRPSHKPQSGNADPYARRENGAKSAEAGHQS